MENNRLELLTPNNSFLLLVDHQPAMFKGIGSGDRTNIKNAAVAVAKTAQLLGIPVVLSSITPASNGPVLSEITELFPNQEVLSRAVPSFNALEDGLTYEAMRQTGRRKLVLAGLWTSMCMCFTAISAVRAGYEVYGIMDATGDATEANYHYGVKRMLQVGVIPVTWMSVISEWMHDWNNPKAPELMREVYAKYDAVLGM